MGKALNFRKRIENLWISTQNKLLAMRRIRKNLTSPKPKLLGNDFFIVNLTRLH